MAASVLPSSIGALPNEAAHEEPKKRRRRRKRKRVIDETTTAGAIELVADGLVDDDALEQTPVGEVVSVEPVKRGRGRPRKVVVVAEAESSLAGASEVPGGGEPAGAGVAEPVKRKPGRPRKVVVDPSIDAPGGGAVATEPLPVELVGGRRRVVIDDEPGGTTFSSDAPSPSPTPRPQPTPREVVAPVDKPPRLDGVVEW